MDVREGPAAKEEYGLLYDRHGYADEKGRIMDAAAGPSRKFAPRGYDFTI